MKDDDCLMMGQKKNTKRDPCPRETANVLSITTFFYTLKTFIKGFKRDLEEEDICEVYKNIESEKLGNKLEKICAAQTNRQLLSSILKVLWKCFYRELLFLTFIDTIYKVSLSNISALTTGKMVEYFSPESNMSSTEAYCYAGLALGFKIFDAFYFQNYLLWLYEFGLKTKTAFCSLMYRKCLRLSPSSISGYNTGKVLTLMTKDVLYVNQFMVEINNLFTEFVQDCVIIYMLHRTIGVTTYVGIGVLFLVIPFQLYLEKLISRIRYELCKKSDVRLQSTQEVLSFIKIIKMYTWELVFAKKISKARRDEVVKLRNVRYLQGLIYVSGSVFTQLALYVVLIVCTSYSDISAEDIFYTVMCFGVLQFSFSRAFPNAAVTSAEMLAGVKRIFALLDAEELPEKSFDKKDPKISVAEIKDASFKVNEDVVLEKITCSMKPGLNIVTGPLGCGKSSLLKMIMKEYPVAEGELDVQGKISYASQEPWLLPGTIRDNILFGEIFDEERYKQVISVCALKYDLDIFINGDQTIIEDNGMNLSGGQQTRINLARAIYRDSDIYLLDDSLAAVDVTVQEHIFSKCIREFLKNKICIFVTHNLKHIKEADQLIILSNGTIHLIKQGSEIDLNELSKLLEISEPRSPKLNEEKKQFTPQLDDDLGGVPNIAAKEDKPENLYKENKKIGKVNISVYRRYFGFGGGVVALIFIASVIIGDQFAGSYREKTLSNWVNFVATSRKLKNENLTDTLEYEKVSGEQRDSFRIYSITFAVTIISALIKTICVSYYMSKISINIHRSMIKNVVTATMDFFDNTFLGNILNRFSTDLSLIDEKLTFVVTDCITACSDILATFVLVATVNAMYLIPSTIISVILLLFRWLYIPTGRSLQRLDNSTRSPVVGHLNSTLSGMVTIRSFDKEKQMMSQFDKHQNLYTSAFHMSLMTQLGFGVYLSLLSFFFSTYVIVDLLFFNLTQAGDAGLVLMKAFKLSENIQFGIQKWALLETLLTSVERVLEYTDVKTEDQSGNQIENWPSGGALEYNKVTLSYPKAKEIVLKELDFKVAPREKIGIVGRTGAGKSSIISTLFRLYDVDGKILIDNEDCKTVSLNCLRSQVSIIPQEPVLFSGSVRYNIDPKSDYPDADIWKVLETVKLRELISDLDKKVGEGEQDFSAGQKQLFCIARALIRKNKIIVLDEPTACLDPESDVLINDIIEREFSSCTVLNIAHKLNSVIDADKILVMEKGEAVEFEPPQSLLANTESLFHKMVYAK